MIWACSRIAMALVFFVLVHSVQQLQRSALIILLGVDPPRPLCGAGHHL